MEVLDSNFNNPTFQNDSPFISDISLQPPSPQSQGHIDLYNTNQDYHNHGSPYSSHSDLSDQLNFSGVVFAGDDGYDPAEFDHPASGSSLLMFDETNELAEYMPYSHPSPFDYRSPSPGSDHGELPDSTRSRASSTSSNNTPFQQAHHSPNMQVAHSFENLSFHSPHWNTEPLPQQSQQPHKPPSPPRLLMSDPSIVVNAPDDGDLSSGPQLHIVPATPVSGGGAATTEVPFQTSLETLRQGSTLEPHHMQSPWLDVDGGKSDPSSRATSPAATTPGPSRSPSASPQLPHPSPHLAPTNLPFLFPGQPQPRSRSKSDTALEPPNWDTVQGLVHADQQHRQQQQHPQQHEINNRSAYGSSQTAHPPTLGQNFTFGPPASSSTSNTNTGGGFLSPELSFHASGIRRSKSDSGGRHRASRSEDIRPPAFDNNTGSNNGYGDGLAAGAGYLYPQDDFMLQQQRQHTGRTPQFLSPSMGAGVPQISGGHSHAHSLSMGSHPVFGPSTIPDPSAGGRGGGHYRRASSGSRSERGTSVGAWDSEVRIGVNNRVNPYPSPNASPRGRYTELRPEPEFDLSSINASGGGAGVGISGRGSQSMHQGGGPQGIGSLLQGPSQGRTSIAVIKPNVTTGRTANASHKRRKQEATFVCPVPGCGSTFTRSFNLKGHIRSHNEEKPFQCHWPGCGKGFARQHDCKRHEQLHTNYRPFTCDGCNKQFARMDALNRHLRSEGGAECLRLQEANGGPGIDGATSSAPTSASPSPAVSTYSQTDGVSVTYSNGEPGYGTGMNGGAGATGGAGGSGMQTKMEEGQWGVSL